MAHNCTQRVRHSKVKVEENKRKAIFKNPQGGEYDITTVDGCLVKDGMKSDYLVTEVGQVSVLVELKGKDVSHACEQLLTTVEHPKVKPLLANRLGFLVICKKYPRFDSFVVKSKQRCAKDYKAGFHVVCDQGEFEIAQVAAINGRV